MKSQMVFCFCVCVFLFYSTEAVSNSKVSHLRYEKLFSAHHPASTNFCNVNKDIRITLLGQAWIQFPLSKTNLSYGNVSEMIDEIASYKSTVVLSNLETAINGTYAQANGATIANLDQPHVADPDVINILKNNYSANFLTASNNHFADFNQAGTISGMQELDAHQIDWTGAGYNDTDARRVTYLSHQNGKKVGVIALVSATQTANAVGWIANATFVGVNGLPMDNAGSFNFVPNPAIAQLNFDGVTNGCQQADLMIQYHHQHWNTSGANLYNVLPWWKTFARQTIDAGASIYLSQGGQNVRAIELYKGNLIFYSNGNLFFEGTVVATPENQEGFIADLCYDGVSTKLKAARVIPTFLTQGDGSWPSTEWNSTHGFPFLSGHDQAMSTLEKLQNLSIPFGTTIEIDEENLVGNIVLTPITPPDEVKECKRNEDLRQAHTTTSLDSSKNPSKVGKKVKFTAKVESAVNSYDHPTSGTVTFTLDGTTSVDVPLEHNGKARWSTEDLSLGTHTVTATFNGDDADDFYDPSASEQVIQVVVLP